jgi:hypothetical protein
MVIKATLLFIFLNQNFSMICRGRRAALLKMDESDQALLAGK